MLIFDTYNFIFILKYTCR